MKSGFGTGVAFGAALVLTALSSAVAGAWALVKFQTEILPGMILVSETEEFLAAVLEDEDNDL